MKYIDLKNYFSDYITFSLSDIRKVFFGFDSRRISEWIKKGYIKKIIKGHYIFTDKKLNEHALYYISNRLLEPSYISMESALSYYGLIPEGVYTVTAVSSVKKINFDTPVAKFSYNKISAPLFFGYDILKIDGAAIKIADAEKTILDYLYFNPKLNNNEAFFELRINIEEFLTKIDQEKCVEYLTLFKNKSLEKRFNKLISFIKNDQFN